MAITTNSPYLMGDLRRVPPGMTLARLWTRDDKMPVVGLSRADPFGSLHVLLGPDDVVLVLGPIDASEGFSGWICYANAQCVVMTLAVLTSLPTLRQRSL